MTRPVLIAALLATLSLPAIAAAWSAYDNAFPSLPCGDGWAACLTSGSAISAGPMRDAGGRPLPSDFRVGWFDLEPTGAFSPFVGLSAYVGPAGGAVAEAAPVDAVPVEPAGDDGLVDAAPVAPSSSAPAAAPERIVPASAPVASSTAPVAAAASSPAATSGTRTPPPTTVASTATATPAPTTTPAAGGVRPSGTSTAAVSTPPATTAAPAAAAVAAVSAPATTGAPAGAQPVSAPATGSDDSCDDLVKLEPAAMMGQLRGGQTKCLDARIGAESAQTMKDKLSRLLIANADAAGNKSEWERLVKRHLEDIDRSDPDLCLRYSQHLSRGGTARAQGVIRWADYALENKSKWSGNTYKSRVFTLLRLRAEAAGKLWQEAETAFTTDRSDEAEAKATKYRGMAKDYAREWLDYAKASTQDTKTAMALCVSAAGNRAFCEGG